MAWTQIVALAANLLACFRHLALPEGELRDAAPKTLRYRLLRLPRPPNPAAEKRADRPTSVPHPPEPTQPGPSGATGEPTVIPDLRPQGLQMSSQEIDFMAGLGRLLPTRAAKKLVNLYRLIRIGIRDADLPAFLAAQPTDTLLTLLGADAAPKVRNNEWTASQETRQRLIDVLKHLDTDASAPTPHTLVTSQQWCPEIARYSFHTRTLAKPSGTIHAHPMAVM